VRLISGLYHYDGKVIVSGNVIEVFEYSKGVFKGFTNENGRRVNGDITDEQKAENRERSLKRARKEFMRIVNANIGCYGDIRPKFVSFTFADNIKDLKEANRIWSKFIKRLNYRGYGRKCSELQYGAVPEFQERGAVHYHVIFFNLPYIDNEELAEIWGQGFIKINAIDDIKNVGAYVCKYMTSSFDDERLMGQKAYFFSRGVRRPKEIYLDYEDLEMIKRSLPVKARVYGAEFNNDFLGVVKYEQYNLSISRNQDFGNVNIAARMQRKGD